MTQRHVKMSATVTPEELSKLHRLAEDEGVPAAQVLRRLIRSAYQKRFGDEKPRTTEPTLRGILTDLTGRAHLMAGNIADRAGLAADVVVKQLEKLERKGVVERVDGSGGRSSWEAKHGKDREKVLAHAEERGFDLDDPLLADEGR